MIDKKEAIGEYFYYSKTLITFCLTTDTLIYSSQVLPNEFERNIGKVLSFVREPKVYRSDSVYCLDYRSAGWELYQQLIKPFDGMLKGKHLIIVPDNKLMYIPFETLLTKETSSKPYNFKELPYLVKEHPVRYLYAASLLNIQRTEHSSGKMAAFVPEYPEEKEDNKNHLAASKTRGQLLDLQQTMNEAKAINSFFPGKVFSKKEASEENFKKNAPQFGTVLLAMHAVIDDENPLYSHLVFTSNSSKNEDDQLYIYETYNLNLNSELLVLSACNTGVGKLRKGEGMMSLTRGFSFAGVQSIVMTLWSVNDNSSADLMKRFYRKLSGLWEKDKALQEAKTEYIQNSDILHAHPYFWAGYVLIGDNKPLHDSRLSVWYWLVLIPLGFAIWFGMRYFRIKSSS
jgi:CHAT domain-containing protein